MSLDPRTLIDWDYDHNRPQSVHNLPPRGALIQMARATGVIDTRLYPDTVEGNERLRHSPPKKFKNSPAGNRRLWQAVQEAMKGDAILTSPNNTVIPTDPWGVFVTARCIRVDLHPDGEVHRQTAIHMLSKAVDEGEAKERIAYLKAQPEVNHCEVCNEPISIWECEMTRLSVFRHKEEALASEGV